MECEDNIWYRIILVLLLVTSIITLVSSQMLEEDERTTEPITACPCQIVNESVATGAALNCSSRHLRDISNVTSGCRNLGVFSFINFSDNELTQYDGSDFFDFRFGTELVLDFSYNNIRDVSNMNLPFGRSDRLAFVRLNFSHNAIDRFSQIITFRLNFVEHYEIDLSHNQINLVDINIISRRIMTLIFRLNNNNITEIPRVLIDTYVGEEVYLDLQYNQIKLLDPKRIEHSGRRFDLNITLKGNPLNCDCQQRWIFDSELSTIRESLNEAICQEPPDVHNRDLLSLSASDLICVLRPSLGETLTVDCPGVNEGYVEWTISRVNDLNKSTGLRVLSDGPLVIENMGPEWEGNYSCNTSFVRHELMVTLDRPRMTTTASSSTVDAKNGTSRNKFNKDPKVVMVILIVVISILSIALFVLAYMYCRSRQAGSAMLNDTAVSVVLKEKNDTLDTTYLPQSKEENSDGVVRPAKSPIARKETKETIYQNDVVHQRGKGRPRVNNGPAKPEDSVRYCNVPASSAKGGDNRESDSQLHYEYVNDVKYLSLNIHEQNQQDQTAYQPIIKS